MAEACMYKVVERCKVAPWSTPEPSRASLPLTFFDMPWIGPHFVKRLYLYQFTHPTHQFQKSLLPILKHSLSLTLHHFFPLSGNLLCPPPPHKPFIHCTGDNSVTLTTLESSADFEHLVANHARDLQVFEYLVPHLPPITCVDDDTLVFPLLALQITVFPDKGLCIGASYRHAVDGRCFNHFMKSWASVSVAGGDLACLEKSLPFYDREVVRDPNGLEAILLTEYFNRRSTWKDLLGGQSQTGDCGNAQDTVKVTFLLSRIDIERLKKWISTQCKIKNKPIPTNLSRFVVTCALVWVCLIKSGRGKGLLDNEEEEEYFFYPADCRNRLEHALPPTYFGNCITPCCAAVKRKELMGEEGVVAAVNVIERSITEIKSERIECAEMWMSELLKTMMLGKPTRVYGSPNLGVYEIDFGFGRPKKIEIVTGLKCISLAETGNEEGGIEVGCVLTRAQLEDFVRVFEQALEALNDIA